MTLIVIGNSSWGAAGPFANDIYNNHIDLFVVGHDGGVYSTNWDQGDGYLGWCAEWYRLTDPSYGDQFTVPPGSTVTALSRFRDHIDLFVVGREGGIYSTFWDNNGGWHGQWFRVVDPSYGDQFTVPPGSTVTAPAGSPTTSTCLWWGGAAASTVHFGTTTAAGTASGSAWRTRAMGTSSRSRRG